MMWNIRRNSILPVIVAVLFCVSGCAAVAVGGAAVTGATGTFFYVNGNLNTDYHYSFEKVWSACEKTVAYMNAVDVIPVKEISKGTIEALIEGEKVTISVAYKAKDLTTVSIRVGILGDKLAAQRLHDTIVDSLLKK